MSAQRYRAAWPYVTVKVLDEAGQATVVGFTEGGIVPPAADPEDVKRLLVKGALVPVDMPEPEKPADKPADKPAAVKPAKEHDPQDVKAPKAAASKAGNG